MTTNNILTLPNSANLGIGTAGTVLTASTTGATWSNSGANFTSSSSNKTIMSIPYNSDEVIIEREAALNVKGKVIINGENLEDRLERIETLLNIPTRDIEMENEFPKLKTLWQEYADELEKYKTWKRLNK